MTGCSLLLPIQTPAFVFWYYRCINVAHVLSRKMQHICSYVLPWHYPGHSKILHEQVGLKHVQNGLGSMWFIWGQTMLKQGFWTVLAKYWSHMAALGFSLERHIRKRKSVSVCPLFKGSLAGFCNFPPQRDLELLCALKPVPLVLLHPPLTYLRPCFPSSVAISVTKWMSLTQQLSLDFTYSWHVQSS